MARRFGSVLLALVAVVWLCGCGGGSETPTSPTPSATSTPSTSTPGFQIAGFATLNGGTTGGRGGASVVVSTLAALQTAAASVEPRIIQISEKISGAAKVDVASNKTIVGLGASGELQGIELNLKGSRNIIIRNLKIHHVLASTNDGDAIHLYDTRNVWVDHCELYAEDPASQLDKDLYDGLLDITSTSEYVTVSWCYFHDHWKCNLVGAADSDEFNRRVTFHHNYYRNINARTPSYRFGQGHVYNSYFVDIATSGVNSRMGAVLRVEGNVFERVKAPITSLDSIAVGFWDVADNQFIDCTSTQPTSSNGSFTPPYSYTLESSSVVKASVPQSAGVGKTDPLQDLP